ncbi:MAG: hypothetical protein KAS16_02385 [Thermoplasmata archaeon]|nr:hypothetical protein [Thermoplasmata archaeon]
MGDDEAKIEKKRLKAEQKTAKKALKAEEKEESQPIEDKPVIPLAAKIKVEESVPQTKPESKPGSPKIIVQMPHVPWYKDPRWISAIIGAVSLSIVLISVFTDWL